MPSPAAKNERFSTEILAVRDGAIKKIRAVTDRLEPVLQPTFAKVITQPIDQEGDYDLKIEQNGRIVTESAFGG